MDLRVVEPLQYYRETGPAGDDVINGQKARGSVTQIIEVRLPPDPRS
jgi:hypothetical protein